MSRPDRGSRANSQGSANDSDGSPRSRSGRVPPPSEMPPPMQGPRASGERGVLHPEGQLEEGQVLQPKCG